MSGLDLSCDPAAARVAPLERRRDLELVAAGWQRRHSTTPARAGEFAELYRTLGFEVSIDAPTPREFGPTCGSCAQQACTTLMVIYTRRTPPAGTHAGAGAEPIP